MSWKEIIKAPPHVTYKEKWSETMDIDDWPKYVHQELSWPSQTRRPGQRSQVTALYEYISDGKYRIIPANSDWIERNAKTLDEEEVQLTMKEANFYWSTFGGAWWKLEENYDKTPQWAELEKFKESRGGMGFSG